MYIISGWRFYMLWTGELETFKQSSSPHHHPYTCSNIPKRKQKVFFKNIIIIMIFSLFVYCFYIFKSKFFDWLAGC